MISGQEFNSAIAALAVLKNYDDVSFSAAYWNKLFRHAVTKFVLSKDTRDLSTLIRLLDNNARKKAVEKLTDILPLRVANESEKITINKKKASTFKWEENIVKELSPVEFIKFECDTNSGLIKSQSKYLDLADLHQFIVDAIIEFRGNWALSQLEEIIDIAARIKDRKMDKT